VIHKAQAEESPRVEPNLSLQSLPIRKTCEPYREVIKQYWGELADTGLFIADKESIGCTANISSKANSDKTFDFCIFQINQEPDTRHDIHKCVKRGYEKYVEGRIGKNNASAWYAVCTTGNNPVPKYAGIKCNN
jgi:hypothetical protein